MILSATGLLGWKVGAKGTLSIVMLFAASLFKISVLDLVDACSLLLLMRSFGYPRAFLAASMSNRSTDLKQSEKLIIRYGWLAIVRMGRTEVQVRVTIRGFVMYRSGYAITLRLHADIHERKFFSQDWGEKRRKTRGTDEGPLHLSPGHTYPDIFQSATLSFRI